MGALKSSWVGEYQGHTVSVERNELTKGYALAWDGSPVAHKKWSLAGLGEIEASVELDGRSVAIRASLGLAGARKCQVWVDGEALTLRQLA